jgi:P-aminobenzoate N-oxygenase AurF
MPVDASGSWGTVQMLIGIGNSWWVPGVALLVVGVVLLAAMHKRRKCNNDVSTDAAYVATLTTLCEGSVRRNFSPYVDIDWNSPGLAVTPNDARWVLPATDPLGCHPWYQAQPPDKQIEIGMWRQANIAKVTLQFENVLIRGLMHYAFRVPNGSPEYRYCLHESVEECNHTMMFQEVVNRIGADVSGMPRWLRWLSALAPLAAGPLPNAFFFGVLAGEVPVDHMQTDLLRGSPPAHPIVVNAIAIHLAEEARHISFAHEYLRKRVPQMWWISRFWLSLYVPVIMRVLGRAVVVPPRDFVRQFSIPRSARRQLFSGTPRSRQMAQNTFADIRMLCHDVGLMNPVALLVWRLCRIDGPPSRYRGEPQRHRQPTSV